MNFDQNKILGNHVIHVDIGTKSSESFRLTHGSKNEDLRYDMGVQNQFDSAVVTKRTGITTNNLANSGSQSVQALGIQSQV